MIVGGVGDQIVSSWKTCRHLPICKRAIDRNVRLETLGRATRGKRCYGGSHARLSIFAGLLKPTAALLKVGHVLVIAPAAIDNEGANLGEIVSSDAEDTVNAL